MRQLVFALIIIILVVTDVAYGIYRERRVTSDVLDEIESLKK